MKWTLTSQQILNPLHIDLHITDLDRILDITLRLRDTGEDLFGYTGDESLEGGVVYVCSLR